MKRLTTIAAAITFACCLGSSAQASTILGTIDNASPFNDVDLVSFMNIFLGLSAPSGPSLIGTETYTRNANPDNGKGSVSLAEIADGADYDSLSFFPGGYEYLLAKYDGLTGFGVVYYLGNSPASSTLSVPLSADNGSGVKTLSGWKVFNEVPDGGSTAALLGSVLVAFGMLRRRFSKS